MLILNIYTIPLIVILSSIFYIIFLRLRKPLEYRYLSSHVPSITQSFWSEIKFSLNLGMKQPTEFLPFFMELVRNNGPIVHFNLSGRSYVLLNDPDDIKILLSSTQNIKKGPEYELLSPWLNEGLLLSSGSKWQSRRKLLVNAFHLKNLEMYNISINKHSRVLVNKLLEASANNTNFSIIEYVSLCSLDMICETIMGVEMKAQEGKSYQYVLSTKKACRSLVERIFTFWLWNDLVFKLSRCGRTFYESIKVLHDFNNNVISKKKMLAKNSENDEVQTDSKLRKSRKGSFIDILFNISKEYPDQMTDKDIQEEVDTFLFAGHDTSSISMTLTLLLLGIYQDIQDKVRDELYNIFGDSDRDVTMEDLYAMRYLEAVIKESLRLYPSVPGITRELETTLKIKNYSIPPMTTILVYPYILHRNEEIYPNPEMFIPERFLDNDNKSKFLTSYIPFSAGMRNCIGQKYAMNQMKTVLSTILRKTRIETLGNRDDIKISMQIVIRLESVPNVKFYNI